MKSGTSVPGGFGLSQLYGNGPKSKTAIRSLFKVTFKWLKTTQEPITIHDRGVTIVKLIRGVGRGTGSRAPNRVPSPFRVD